MEASTGGRVLGIVAQDLPDRTILPSQWGTDAS